MTFRIEPSQMTIDALSRYGYPVSPWGKWIRAVVEDKSSLDDIEICIAAMRATNRLDDRELNRKYIGGYTILHLVVLNFDLWTAKEIYNQLVKYGADPTIKSWLGFDATGILCDRIKGER